MEIDYNKAPNSKHVEWMSEGTYGMMVHYLIYPDGNTEEEKTNDFNKTIDNFDLELFINDFKTTKADWLIFTIGQNTGYWNSSNAYIDSKISGRTPKRDLVLEIAKEVKKLGKRFIAYLPGEVVTILREKKIDDIFDWNEEKPDGFLKAWSAILRDYSLKLGDLCDGWWIDGCYEQIHHNTWDWKIFADAMRAGNPNSAVSLSDASFCCHILKSLTSENDYFPGEVHMLEDGVIRIDPAFGNVHLNENGKIRVGEKAPEYFIPEGKYIDGTLLHALVPMDLTFNEEVKNEWIQYPVSDIIKLAHSFNDVGGAITYNVPIDNTGKIRSSSLEKLIALGNSFK